MDELSVAGPSTVVEVDDGVVSAPYLLTPEECGIARHGQSCLTGGGPSENAAITRGVLAGSPGAHRDVVVLNAAAALYVAGAVSNMGNGVLRARESIDSGRAARILAGMVEVTNELVEARR